MYYELFKGHKTNTKWFKWYCNIILNAKQHKRRRGRGIYFEVHHILPRSMGGSNNQYNTVLLTAKEHHICHHLLYLFTTGIDKHKMAFAWNMMCWDKRNPQRELYVNSRLYEKARKAFSESISIINSGSNPKLKTTLRNKSKYGNVNYIFYNVNTKESFFGTEFDLIDYDSSMSHGEVERIIEHTHKCSRGWMVMDSNSEPPTPCDITGRNSAVADLTEYVFIDTETGTEYKCDRHTLADLFPHKNITAQGVTDLIKGRQKSHRGFTILRL